jgi:23S rRNA U2552 (ribose-2'-O)-methylase RlmE/FtsJ
MQPLKIRVLERDADPPGGGGGSAADIQSRLAQTKGKIDDKRARWDSMKRFANPFETVSQHCMVEVAGPRPVSRSFFKMWEILHEFPVLQRMLAAPGRVACVAEGPGGFVQAILRMRRVRVDVITLVSRESPCMRVYDANVSIHNVDGSGDICRPFVAREFTAAVAGASLFTADGGFDVHGQFDQQEAQSLDLLRAEVCIGIAALRAGGCMVVKFYDVFLDGTKQLVAWMHECFDEVYVYKPFTSRPANSERYMVCIAKRPACALADAITAFVRSPRSAAQPRLANAGVTRAVDAINDVFGQRQLDSIDAALGCTSAPDDRERMAHVLRWCQRFDMKVNVHAIQRLKATAGRSERDTSAPAPRTPPATRAPDACDASPGCP